MTVSRERARRAVALFEAMAAGGFLGTDPETAWALADLREYVEQTPNPEGEQHGEKDPEAEDVKLKKDA